MASPKVCQEKWESCYKKIPSIFILLCNQGIEILLPRAATITSMLSESMFSALPSFHRKGRNSSTGESFTMEILFTSEFREQRGAFGERCCAGYTHIYVLIKKTLLWNGDNSLLFHLGYLGCRDGVAVTYFLHLPLLAANNIYKRH